MHNLYSTHFSSSRDFLIPLFFHNCLRQIYLPVNMINHDRGSSTSSRTAALQLQQSDQEEDKIDLNDEDPRWRGIMKGHYLDISFAASVLILPMLALVVVLMALVYTHIMPDNSSTYSTEHKINIPLGAAYYVNYSATRLVFIASASSTLSTILISSAMILFSFLLAASLVKKSDAESTPGLPTPFQLELLIRTIDGRLTVIWAWLRYAFSSKKRRVQIVPDLWKAVIMLLALVILACVHQRSLSPMSVANHPQDSADSCRYLAPHSTY